MRELGTGWGAALHWGSDAVRARGAGKTKEPLQLAGREPFDRRHDLDGHDRVSEANRRQSLLKSGRDRRRREGRSDDPDGGTVLGLLHLVLGDLSVSERRAE